MSDFEAPHSGPLPAPFNAWNDEGEESELRQDHVILLRFLSIGAVAGAGKLRPLRETPFTPLSLGVVFGEAAKKAKTLQAVQSSKFAHIEEDKCSRKAALPKEGAPLGGFTLLTLCSVLCCVRGSCSC